MSEKSEIESLEHRNWKLRNSMGNIRLQLCNIERKTKDLELLLNSIWLHHQDGSDLMVNQDELFDLIQNKALRQLLHMNDYILKAKENIVKIVKADKIDNQIM